MPLFSDNIYYNFNEFIRNFIHINNKNYEYIRKFSKINLKQSPEIIIKEFKDDYFINNILNKITLLLYEFQFTAVDVQYNNSLYEFHKKIRKIQFQKFSLKEFKKFLNIRPIKVYFILSAYIGFMSYSDDNEYYDDINNSIILDIFKLIINLEDHTKYFCNYLIKKYYNLQKISLLGIACSANNINVVKYLHSNFNLDLNCYGEFSQEFILRNLIEYRSIIKYIILNNIYHSDFVVFEDKQGNEKWFWNSGLKEFCNYNKVNNHKLKYYYNVNQYNINDPERQKIKIIIENNIENYYKYINSLIKKYNINIGKISLNEDKFKRPDKIKFTLESLNIEVDYDFISLFQCVDPEYTKVYSVSMFKEEYERIYLNLINKWQNN